MRCTSAAVGTRLLSLFVLVGLSVAGSAAAGAGATPRRVAVFPITVKGKVDPALVEQIQKLLDDGPTTNVEMSLLTPKLLARALDLPPQKVMGKCERAKRFDQCLAKAAVKLEVDEILASRLAVTADGNRLLVLGVSAAAKVQMRLNVTGLTPGTLSSMLGPEQVAKAYGVPYYVPPPPPAVVAAPAGAGVGSPGGTAAAGPATIAAGGGSGSNGTQPALGTLMPGAGGSYAAVDPLAASHATLPPAPPPPPRSKALRWAAVALAGVGLASVGVGAYSGMQASKTSDLDPATGLTQRQAVDRYDSADAQASRANLLFGAGGGAVGVGTILLLVDLIRD